MIEGSTRARATGELTALVYAELKRLASAQRSQLRPGETLRTTALVHEAFLKLVGSGQTLWESRGHFLVIASQAMREVIVDHIRKKSAQKRGSGRAPEPLDAAIATAALGDNLDDVLAVDAAVASLGIDHPRKAQVVVMRYFAGLSEHEIADALGITPRTVERDWRFSRAYLRSLLSREPQ